MAVLSSFSPPGHVPDGHPGAWSATVSQLISQAAEFPQFYDPTVTDSSPEAQVAPVVWPAFPASLRGTQAERFELADKSRGRQDEYCEWAVERDAEGKITRITFTTEVPEYFHHLFDTHPDGLVALYQEFMGEEIALEQLQRDGQYLPANQWNDSTEGRPAHLIQTTNTLGAAITLAAQATVLRVDSEGNRVAHKQQLVQCGRLGEPLRNSDPQIASAVNDAAAAGAEITLNDPVGLYIDGLITGGMETPDGEDPAAFWRRERGDAQHTLRAAYEVPQNENRGYVVGDILVNGRPIEFGGQLAIRVRVRIDAVVSPAGHEPQAEPCLES